MERIDFSTKDIKLLVCFGVKYLILITNATTTMCRLKTTSDIVPIAGNSLKITGTLQDVRAAE